MVAIVLAVILAPGVFFALRTGKHKDGIPTTGEGKNSVIVHTSTAYQGDMGVYVDALGTVTPITTVNIYSQVTGEVLAVRYREGQIVHKGDPLIDIDPRPYRAQLQQAEGLLDHDRGVLKQAEIDLAVIGRRSLRTLLQSRFSMTRSKPSFRIKVLSNTISVKRNMQRFSLATAISQLPFQAGLVCDLSTPGILFLRVARAPS
jgi:multidrug efflux pump subunit AcrA (membrane-fusion protein)